MPPQPEPPSASHDPADPWPRKTLVMGVLNATPDSFFPGSRVPGVPDAVARARDAIDGGADVLDVGGESTRPGSAPVGLEEELRRVIPIVESVAPLGCPISVDTYRAETARRALAAGATWVNDITGLRGDAEMAGVIAEHGAECVIMHMQGTPETMQAAPQYTDVVGEIRAFFEERMAYATLNGVPEGRIWLDPGFGFGKTLTHNLTLLRRLGELTRLGRPILVGTSNKSMVGAVLKTDAHDRLEGTAATVALAIAQGAACVRVHDVRAMARVARMCDAVLGRIDLE